MSLVVATPELDSMPNVEMATMGLQIAGEISFDEWRQIGTKLRDAGQSWQWWVGDWLNYGEKQYGGKYKEAVRTLGLSVSRLSSIAYVCREFEIFRRRKNLPFSHHEEVGAIPDKDEWLNKADAENWSVKKLRSEVRKVVDATKVTKAEQIEESTPNSVQPVAEVKTETNLELILRLLDQLNDVELRSLQVEIGNRVDAIAFELKAGEKEPEEPKTAPKEYPAKFEEFWAVYPRQRRTRKPKALAAWKKSIKLAAPELIISKAKKYAASPLGKSDYVVMPERFLTGAMWEDDEAAWQRCSDSKPKQNFETPPAEKLATVQEIKNAPRRVHKPEPVVFKGKVKV